MIALPDLLEALLIAFGAALLALGGAALVMRVRFGRASKSTYLDWLIGEPTGQVSNRPQKPAEFTKQYQRRVSGGHSELRKLLSELAGLSRHYSGVLVIGNGESRRRFELPQSADVLTIGCNALYRDYTPHFLVVQDRAMLDEVEQANYRKWVITTPSYDGPLARVVLNDTASYNAGVTATLAACVFGFEVVHLLGFDGIRSQDGTVNNIYKGTANYRPAGAHVAPFTVDPLDAGWSAIQETYPQVRLVSLGPNGYGLPTMDV